MQKYKVLVLTDHSGHSDQNSIYAILNEMLLHEKCESIDIVSRGIEMNDSFFKDQDSSKIFGTRLDNNFKYTTNGFYYKENLKSLTLDDFDLVFMRLPRPISDQWLKWLSHIAANAVIMNNPLGIIKTSNKKYMLNFPDLCQSMKFCNSRNDVLEVVQKYPVVLKPLKEYGGKGIVKINGDKVDIGDKEISVESYLNSIEEALISDGYLAMKYLKNVAKGDKRILVVGGQIMASSLRIPAEGSWLCNVSQGGQSVKSEVTKEEELIVKRLTPSLMEEGIVMFGVDTLEDDNGERILSEINTLSIGGFPQAQKQSGRPIIKMTLDKIFDYADGRK